MKKLPIGISTFSEIIEEGYIYVDKTPEIYEMVTGGKAYFLSRPRRFGKSLLVSTFEELFKGNKKLFEGLYIYNKWDWSEKFPVIHLDFGDIDYKTSERLEMSLEDFISDIADKFDITLKKRLLNPRFGELIEKIHEKMNKKVVILIDEYDKAIVKNISNPKVLLSNKIILQNFYGTLKSNDKYINFLFVTGVSKFTGTSLFSDFNNPDDITLDYKYSSICGYTQEDLEEKFKSWVKKTSKTLNCPERILFNWIREWYNGYSWDGKERVYNPFSILYLFSKQRFGNYWYRTATPSFLKDKIVAKNNIEPLIENTEVFADMLDSSDPLNVGEIPLLFQTGYLTIKKVEIRQGRDYFTIGIPNLEVKESLFDNLLKDFTDKTLEEIQRIKMEITEQLENSDEEGLRENISSLLANIPYKLHGKEEKYYHSIFLVWLETLGLNIEAINITNIGEIDSIIKLNEKTIVIEIKYSKSENEEDLNKAIEKAFKQINDKKYFEKYLKQKNVELLAIAFNRKEVLCEFREL